MESGQGKILSSLILVVFLFWLVLSMVGNFRETVTVPPDQPPAFDSSRAYRMISDYVTRFPRRTLGSIEARMSTGFFRQQLEPLGYTISYMHFDAVVAGRRQVGRNVLAYKPGKVPEMLAILAHYDTARTTVQGASDDGSGVGVLLELARVFSVDPTRRSLLLVLTDGEEWGMLGARDLSRNYPDRSKIVAGLALDSVSIGTLSEFILDTVGQTEGYTPPWLRRLARGATETQALPVFEPSGFSEHFERALLLSATDQGPLLEAGIPAIGLGSEAADKARALAIYHSAQDTVENLEVASVEKYGKAAEKLLRMLDGLPAIPRESMGIFLTGGKVFLTPGLMLFLHLVTFLPLFVAAYFHWANHRAYVSSERILRELLTLGCFLLTFLAAYYVIVLLRLLRVLPGFSLYPGTAKDPVLEQVSWKALGILAAVVLVFALVGFFLVRFSCLKMQRPDFYVSKFVLLAELTVLVCCALVYNPYWAVTFLALPSWIWMLVGVGKGTGGRVANAIWILAAGIPCFMMLGMFSSRLGLGWKVLWYEILMLSTGTFTFAGYLLGCTAICLGIRFFLIQFQGRAEPLT